MNGYQLGNFALGIRHDFIECIAAQREVTHHHLAPLEWRLPRVGRFGQQAVQPVVTHLVAATVAALFIKAQRQHREGLRQHADAAVDGAEPHGRAGRDAQAGA